MQNKLQSIMTSEATTMICTCLKISKPTELFCPARQNLQVLWLDGHCTFSSCQLAFYDATISCHQDYRQSSIMKCHAKTVQGAMNDTLSLKLELRVNNAPNTAVKHVM